MLERLIERTCIADGKNAVVRLASRPADRTILLDRQVKFDIAAGFHARPGDFAITLDCMAIAEENRAPGTDTGKLTRQPVVKPR